MGATIIKREAAQKTPAGAEEANIHHVMSYLTIKLAAMLANLNLTIAHIFIAVTLNPIYTVFMKILGFTDAFLCIHRPTYSRSYGNLLENKFKKILTKTLMSKDPCSCLVDDKFHELLPLK